MTETRAALLFAVALLLLTVAGGAVCWLSCGVENSCALSSVGGT